ncbi:MAG TPA: cupin domain-containing protein [Burkholderiales bacterium]|jgi:uncharacterized cupin superfamily protein
MSKHVINIADVKLEPRPQQFAPTGEAAQRFEARVGQVGRQIGAKKLGYNITAVPPGKRAYPFHNHRLNEEMFYVLEGRGEVRIGAETFPIRAGDFIACPPGGQELAHQIANTGTGELKYLAVSTMRYPEVCEYPDSGKIGVIADSIRYVNRLDSQVGYWEGE